MKLEKTKNARRNILFGILNKVITMFLPFVVRSVIIYALSAEYLGLNSLFSSILQVLNLTELGFSSAMVYSMYKPIAENDDETICALLNFYRKIYFIIGCIVLSLGLLLLPFLDKLINGDVPDNINIYILYLCYLVNTVLSYMMFAYRSSLLNAHQRTDVISNINTITLGSMYFLQIIVLIATKNYYTYVLMMPAFTILNNLIVAGVSRKYYPQYECKGELDSTLISGIKKQTVGLMVNKICAVSRNSLDNIFVSTFLGLAATAMYGNYYYIMNAIIAILMVVSNGLLAGVGNSIVTESPEKNYSDLNKINFVYMWFAGWCTICLICLYQPFMKLWVGKN
ncbi:MAG: lipopolysaccharide biosynthesis protein [Mediterraneibacter faecis]